MFQLTNNRKHAYTQPKASRCQTTVMDFAIARYELEIETMATDGHQMRLYLQPPSIIGELSDWVLYEWN